MQKERAGNMLARAESMLMGMRRSTNDRMRLAEIEELLKSVRSHIKSMAQEYDPEWLTIYIRYMFWTRLASLQINVGHTSHYYSFYA